MRSIWVDVSVAALMSSLTACVSSQQPRCHGGEQAAVADTLYFGTQEPHGVVTNEEWTGFLKDVVTPRFPHGFTVMEGSGQWLSASRAPVHESTHILYLVHPDDEASDALLTRVITEYRTRFSQESVLRVKVRACAAF
jgi:hypothetical protein